MYIAISGLTVKSPSAQDNLVEIVPEVVPTNCSYRFLIPQRFIFFGTGGVSWRWIRGLHEPKSFRHISPGRVLGMINSFTAVWRDLEPVAIDQAFQKSMLYLLSFTEISKNKSWSSKYIDRGTHFMANKWSLWDRTDITRNQIFIRFCNLPISSKSRSLGYQTWLAKTK